MRIDIRLKLDGEAAKEFQKLKRQLKMKNNTDVLRYLISYYSERNKILTLLESLHTKVDKLQEQLKKKGEYKLCPECGGKGYIPTIPAGKKVCPKCHGTGAVET
jgi:lipopolysaccharide biosynthesis regulator YciM